MFGQLEPVKPSTDFVTVDLTNTVLLTDDELCSKLDDASLADEQYYKLITSYYKKMLDDIFTKKETRQASVFTKYFTQSRFVSVLTQIMYTVEITDIDRRRLNKMCYDYLSISEADEYVTGLLMALSKTVNRDKLPRLCAIPLPEDLATMLALSRYSSEKDVVNVRRLNKVLMSQSIEFMTEQKIIDIYTTLFSHVLPLFTGVMLDVVSPQNLSSNSSEVYGTISLAILDIMNELPLADIKKGLKLFDENRKMQYPDNPLRFNIESFSPVDYPRINKALDDLKSEGVVLSIR